MSSFKLSFIGITRHYFAGVILLITFIVLCFFLSLINYGNLNVFSLIMKGVFFIPLVGGFVFFMVVLFSVVYFLITLNEPKEILVDANKIIIVNFINRQKTIAFENIINIVADLKWNGRFTIETSKRKIVVTDSIANLRELYQQIKTRMK